MNTAAPRPRPVSSGATLVIVGAVFVVISAWQQIAGLHTLEVQDQLRQVLTEPPLDGLGMGVDGLQDLLRVSSLVAGAVAAAMAVLGGFTLRRDPRARIGLAVLAIPLLASGLVVAGLITVLVVVGVAMLWSPTAGAWLHGRPLPAGPGSSPADRGRTPTGVTAAGRSAPAPGPASDSDSSTPPADPAAPPVPSAPATWAPGNPYHPPARARSDRGARPAALLWACIVTWVSTAAIGGGLLLTALVLGLAGDEFFDEMRRQQPALDQSGYTDSELRTTILLLAAVVVPWCVIAAVLAVLAFLGRAWARVSLVVCAGLAVVLALLAAVSSPLLVVFLVPLALTVILLARPEVGAWYRREPLP